MSSGRAQRARGATASERRLLGASRALLQCVRGANARPEFLRRVSEVLWEHVGAVRVELWFEDGRQRYRWVADAEDQTHLTVLDRADTPLAHDVLAASELPGSIREALQQEPTAVAWTPAVRHDPEGASIGALPFHSDGHSEGLLILSSDRAERLDHGRVVLCEGLSQVLGVAISSRRDHAALRERVKELGCLYAIAEVAGRPGLPLEEAMDEVVELLPPAWQYPEITTARITLDGRVSTSRGFHADRHHLAAEVVARGRVRGSVEVFYRCSDEPRMTELTLRADNPFLDEERHLIEGVARELGFVIERREAEEERNKLQLQVRHADRLATIGQLAAGVAHELNEPLTNILGFAQLAGRAAGLPQSTRADLQKIERASLYAREVIKKLMLFSRRGPSHSRCVDLNQVVEDSLFFLEARCAKQAIAVERDLAPELPCVVGDSSQLQQVIVNLVVNATHAMPRGGTLRLRTEERDGALVLVVEDSGVGMPAETVARIFEPFFTTKDVGQGTGLGLAVVHGIVDAHGGSVQVHSEVGRGTQMAVHLPVSKDRG